MAPDLRRDLGNDQAHVHMCQAEKEEGRARLEDKEYWARYAEEDRQ